MGAGQGVVEGLKEDKPHGGGQQCGNCLWEGSEGNEGGYRRVKGG